MNRGTLLLLVAMLCLAAPLAAQSDPDTGPQTVLIKLKSQGSGPREIVLGPHAVAACKQNKGCSDHFTLRWIGSKNAGEKLLVEFTTPGSGDCFDKIYFTIDDTGQPAEKTVTVRDSPLCVPKTAFNFDVSCIGGAGDNCGGVAKLDPGAMVGGGTG